MGFGVSLPSASAVSSLQCAWSAFSEFGCVAVSEKHVDNPIRKLTAVAGDDRIVSVSVGRRILLSSRSCFTVAVYLDLMQSGAASAVPFDARPG